MNSRITSALKEWAVVCEALGRGFQVIVPRTGGIEEADFEAESPWFALLPTRFHEDLSLINPQYRDVLSVIAPPPDGQFAIQYIAQAEPLLDVSKEAALDVLAGHQVLSRDVLRDRFFYRDEPLRVMPLRVYRLPKPVSLLAGGWSRGCRSWVHLPGDGIDAEGAVPVLGEAAYGDALAAAVAACGLEMSH